MRVSASAACGVTAALLATNAFAFAHAEEVAVSDEHRQLELIEFASELNDAAADDTSHNHAGSSSGVHAGTATPIRRTAQTETETTSSTNGAENAENQAEDGEADADAADPAEELRAIVDAAYDDYVRGHPERERKLQQEGMSCDPDTGYPSQAKCCDVEPSSPCIGPDPMAETAISSDLDFYHEMLRFRFAIFYHTIQSGPMCFIRGMTDTMDANMSCSVACELRYRELGWECHSKYHMHGRWEAQQQLCDKNKIYESWFTSKAPACIGPAFL